MDERAKNILFDTYWSSAGWRHKPGAAAADFEYAKSKGVMFDPISLSHDELIAAIVRLRNRVEPEKATRAFLGSLSTRQLHWRSSLASTAFANTISSHAYEAKACGGTVTHTSYRCGVCGGSETYQDIDLNVLNFERIKWGGVRLGNLVYTWLDLFLLEHGDIAEPTAADIDIFRAILSAIAASSSGDSPGTLERRLASVLPSSKAERHVLIEILACSGLLKPSATDRPMPGKTDWRFAVHWRGEDGYDAQTVSRYFGTWFSTRH